MELASNVQAISITNQVPTIESSVSVRSEFTADGACLQVHDPLVKKPS